MHREFHIIVSIDMQYTKIKNHHITQNRETKCFALMIFLK